MENGQGRMLRCDRERLTYDVCGRLVSQGGFCHHRRSFDCHVLILVLEGKLYITANGTPHTVRAEEYIFLRAGEEHFGYEPSRGRLTYLWVHLRDEGGFTPCQPGEQGAGYTFAEHGDAADAPRLYGCFRQMIDLSLEEPGYPQAMMDCALSMLMMELARLQTAQRPAKRYPPVITASMEWIRGHFQQPFTVKELAQHVGYQADYLSTLFKRSVGVSIVTYTTQLRLRMAKALLTSTGVTIKEAAYSCGFPDEKYFMRVFKLQEGITPSQFRSLQVK